jgi:5-methylcytosine-specific restriction enzyme A
MNNFDWDNINSRIFSLSNVANRVNADKLFVCFLMEIEKRGIDTKKSFTIAEISDLVPKGTAGVNNNSTYGFSIMSMLSGQKQRDYFIFENSNLRDEFTAVCNNNHDRDNYFWKKHYLNERLWINTKYLI